MKKRGKLYACTEDNYQYPCRRPHRPLAPLYDILEIPGKKEIVNS